MSLLCTLSGHRASSLTMRNDGQHFSRCTRCGIDLVEHESGWRSAPKGQRIVWKAVPINTPSEPPASPTPATPGEQRIEGERRRSSESVLPKFLGGRDRRRGRNRRKGFGKRAAQPLP